MMIKINGVGMKVSEDSNHRIKRKLEKFHRFFDDEAVANVKLTPDKDKVRTEITIKIHRHYYRAEAVDEDLYQAFDHAIEILEGQIRKHKAKIKKQSHNYAYMKEYLLMEMNDSDDDYFEEEEEIIKHKTFNMRPMTSEEAILQMEMLGHHFFVYLDSEIEKICVVYKRNDGKYGVIEPNI